METDMTATAHAVHGVDLKLPCYDAEKLTLQAGMAHIVLRDQVYTLRITRAGKLILTK